MPGADDKVILSIKLELKNVLKDLKQVKNRIDEIEGKVKKRDKEENIIHDKKDKKEKKLHKERLRREAELAKSRKQESVALESTSKQLKKQHFLLRDMSGIQNRLFNKSSEFAKKHPWLAASARGVARPVGWGVRGARAGVGAFAAISSGLIGMLVSGIQQSYGTYLQVGQAMGTNVGRGTMADITAGGRFSRLGRGGRRGGMVGGGRLGYRMTETFPQAAAVGRAVGNIGAVYRAQQFARAGGGMEVGEATGIMGQLRQAGITFETPTGKKGKEGTGAKLLAKLLEGAVESGLERARVPEYLSAVANMAERGGERQAGKVDVQSIGAFMSLLGQIPGMQGRRGASLMNKLDTMITAPGGGEAGQALILQGLGYGKPGGTTNYYDAYKRQQRGLTGVQGAENLLDIMKEINLQYGKPGAGGKTPASQGANLAVTTLAPGITLDMVEELQEVVNSSVDQKEKLRQISQIMDKSLPIEEQALKAMKGGFAAVLSRMATVESRQYKTALKSYKTIESLEDAANNALVELMEFFKRNENDIMDAIKAMGEFAKIGIQKWGGIAQGGIEAAKKAAEAGKGFVGQANAALTGGLGALSAHERAKKKAEIAKQVDIDYSHFPKSRRTRIAKAIWDAGVLYKAGVNPKTLMSVEERLRQLQEAEMTPKEREEKEKETGKKLPKVIDPKTASAKELAVAKKLMKKSKEDPFEGIHSATTPTISSTQPKMSFDPKTGKMTPTGVLPVAPLGTPGGVPIEPPPEPGMPTSVKKVTIYQPTPKAAGSTGKQSGTGVAQTQRTAK